MAGKQSIGADLAKLEASIYMHDKNNRTVGRRGRIEVPREMEESPQEHTISKS